MDLSIVIVTWNTKRLTLDCIESVLKNTPSDDFSYEIILVDNASVDGTLEEVAVRYPNVKLIKNSDNLGFAKANNIGIASAAGKAVLLLNSDTLIKGDAIYQTFKFLMSKSDKVGAASCKVLDFNGKMEIHCRQFYTWWGMLKRQIGKICIFLPNFLRNRLNIDYWPHNSIRSVDWVHMSFFMVKKSVLDIVGGLDERFFFYSEDQEYCYRVHKYGFGILFFPDCEILHKNGGSTKNKKTSKFFDSMFIFYDINNMKIEKAMLQTYISIRVLYKKLFARDDKERSIENKKQSVTNK